MAYGIIIIINNHLFGSKVLTVTQNLKYSSRNTCLIFKKQNAFWNLTFYCRTDIMVYRIKSDFLLNALK